MATIAEILVLTDVPAGAWTTALLLDVLGERRGATIAVGVGVLGAAASGVTDWLDTYGTSRKRRWPARTSRPCRSRSSN